MISSLASAPPEISVPTWPMRLPGGAVTPAMKPTTGFIMSSCPLDAITTIRCETRSSTRPTYSSFLMSAPSAISRRFTFWPSGPGLVRDELHAEDLVRVITDLVDRLRHLHATALAAAACMNLRLDDPDRAAQLPCGLDRIVLREHGFAARDRDAEFPRNFLTLVLVNLQA